MPHCFPSSSTESPQGSNKKASFFQQNSLSKLFKKDTTFSNKTLIRASDVNV